MKEAMKLALEVLKDSQDYKMGRAMTVEATEALEEALAEQHLQALHDENKRLGLYEHGEPVAWMHPDWPDGYSGFQSPVTTYMTNGWIPLYTTPPQGEARGLSQQQRTWVGLTDEEIQDAGRFSYCRGGTSEKLYHIMWNSQPSACIGWSREELIAFTKAIEAKLKESDI
jgi:hypothetical protein